MLDPFFSQKRIRDCLRHCYEPAAKRVAPSRRLSLGSEPTTGEQLAAGHRPWHNNGLTNQRTNPLLCSIERMAFRMVTGGPCLLACFCPERTEKNGQSGLIAGRR
jgi:hypothetical protein